MDDPADSNTDRVGWLGTRCAMVKDGAIRPAVQTAVLCSSTGRGVAETRRLITWHDAHPDSCNRRDRIRPSR